MNQVANSTELKSHFYGERAEELRTIADNQQTVDGRAAWLLLAYQAQRYADWYKEKEQDGSTGGTGDDCH